MARSEKHYLGLVYLVEALVGFLGCDFNHKKRKHYFMWTFPVNITIWESFIIVYGK